MGQTTDEIENHIDNKRENLKANLQELENRVKSAIDWRHYFKRHTGTMIAAAFGGGMLLSSLLGKRQSAALPSANSISPVADAVRARLLAGKMRPRRTGKR